MTKAEELRQEAADSGVDVIDWNFTNRIKGLYCDGVIAITRSFETYSEEAAILAEELGHHLTAAGNILDQADPNNRKQEIRGRVWAYNRLIGLEGIVMAYKRGCTNRYEIAEELGVPEDMLDMALERYKAKYGTCAKCGKYIVYFEPLGVMKLL